MEGNGTKGNGNVRVVVFLIDHIHLRPGRELHVVVRAGQACQRISTPLRFPTYVHGPAMLKHLAVRRGESHMGDADPMV